MTSNLPSNISEVPEYLKQTGAPEGSNAGMLDDETGVVRIPWLKICYETSKSEVSDNCTPGHFYSMAHMKELPYPFEFVVIEWAKRWVMFKPEEEGGGIDWATNDPHDEKVKALGDEAYRALRLQALVVVLGQGDHRPEALSFHGTNYGIGCTLYSMLKKFNLKSAWSPVYKFTGFEKKKMDRGFSYIPKHGFSRYVTADENEIFSAMHNEFSLSKVRDDEDQQETGSDEAPF